MKMFKKSNRINFTFFASLLLVFLLCFTLTSCREKNPPVVVQATAVDISIGKDSIFIDETTSLEYKVLPDDFSQEVTVTVSDPSVAKVEEGRVIGLTSGSTKITVESTNAPVSNSVTITVMPNLENEEYLVKYIATGAGDDASTSTTISYHAYNKNTSIEYTLASDTNFNNTTSIKGYCYYFCQLEEKLTTPFPERYVYRTTLNNLTPNTEYIYRINQGDNTYSDTYHFKTAAGSGDTSFLFLADIHYWAKEDGTSHGSEVSEKTIAKALEINPNINLVIDGGDTVDTGGDEDCWRVMYEHRLSFKNLLYATVPGNHEYYITGTGQWDNRFSKAFTPTNLNGPAEKNGTTYYFQYNDVLFLMIDNASKVSYNEQLTWIENLLRTTTAKYVVADMHIPINASAPSTDSDPKLMALFEKYSVDLVLLGHYHSEDYSTAFDNGAGNDDAGVTYLRGSFAGAKSAGTNVEESISGYIVDISEEGQFTIRKINGNGTILWTRQFNTKKYRDATPASKQAIIDSFQLNHDPDNLQFTSNWTELAYGNLKSITIKETLRNELNKEVLILSKGYVQTALSINRMAGYDYHFQVEFLFNDQTTETKEFTFDLQTVANISISNINKNSARVTFTRADSTLNWVVESYNIYINGELYRSEIPYSSTFIELTNLKRNTDYLVECHAIGYEDEIVYIKTANFKTSK